MVIRVKTVAFQGIETQSVEVQVQLQSGLPAFNIVGLADKTVAEARERIRAALYSMGLAIPAKRITINLAPADLQKEGTHYDLPMLMGLLAAMEVIPSDSMDNFLVMGELSLDGQINKVNGVLPSAIHASVLDLGIVCPKSCGAEATWAGDMCIIAPDNVLGLINHLKGVQFINRPEISAVFTTEETLCFSDVKGQIVAKRALEIVAAGGHNLLMQGPPGAGKSMLASRLPSILPQLSPQEALEVSMVYSIAGMLDDKGLVVTRPFREPHHSASLPALVGGGLKARPGEISLAHNGILFMDEFPEFSRSSLEAMRQPLETGKITVARANNHVTYPANFQLIAAMNPCKCGYLGDRTKQCTRAPNCGREYMMKLSGPLLDRIDLQLDVPAVSINELNKQNSAEEASKDVLARVTLAKDKQHKRYGNAITNATAKNTVLEDACALESDARTLLVDAANKLQLSARGYYRVMRVSRTIADLEQSQSVSRRHVCEALSYRLKLGASALETMTATRIGANG
ncbi:MAG: YifB family Mg chelatase-like AAA ATPase [Holosporales bacterium]|nr:YifB family Mg chelatase-like AAA ATPase [Holosporales bacterium]